MPAYVYILRYTGHSNYFIGACTDIKKTLDVQFSRGIFDLVVNICPGYVDLPDANWSREVMYNDLQNGGSIYDIVPYNKVWLCSPTEALRLLHLEEVNNALSV